MTISETIGQYQVKAKETGIDGEGLEITIWQNGKYIQTIYLWSQVPKNSVVV